MDDSASPGDGPLTTATHWGTYTVEREAGQIARLRPMASDPDPSPIADAMPEMLDHPTRIRRPAIRRSFLAAGHRAGGAARGAEPFVEVPWDEALEIAAGELERVRRQHGNSAIFGGSYGWASAGRFHHAQSQIHRFLNCMGGYTASIDTYSFAAVSALMPHLIGHFRRVVLNGATSWVSIAKHTDLLVMFGGLARKNAQVTSGVVGRHILRESLLEAKARGCGFVNVSPIRADTIPEISAAWLPVRPGSDTALMLGLAHSLLAEGLENRTFLASHCTGWERVRAYILGESDGFAKTPEWAASLSEIPADEIRALARRMAASRTMIAVAWSVQRADHGEQPCWMALVLAAMLGQIGLPGGGVGYGYASENGVGNPVRQVAWPSVPQGQNGVAREAAIPVARISDMLLSPGASYQFNGTDRRYPDIRVVAWAGGNPFHHHQDLGRLVRALRRPECVMVNEIWWTPMARHADIVFPVTSPLEREDIAMSPWEPMAVAMRKASEPAGEARDDHAVFAGLAGKLGLREAFTEGRAPEDWIRGLWDQARQQAGKAGIELPSLEGLREVGALELPLPERDQVMLEEFRADPAAHPLETESGRLELYCDRIARMGYEDCPGHPVWRAPQEWLGGAAARRYPLHLISNQPTPRLHSQLDPGSVSAKTKIAGREPLTMHPADAAARGLAAGAVVRVFNGRGACLAGLRISDEVRPGVVQLSTGAWYDPDRPGDPDALCKHGNANVLTRDAGTSRLGQGPSAMSALVEVECYPGEPPAVTAYDPPEIVPRP